MLWHERAAIDIAYYRVGIAYFRAMGQERVEKSYSFFFSEELFSFYLTFQELPESEPRPPAQVNHIRKNTAKKKTKRKERNETKKNLDEEGRETETKFFS